MKKLTWIVAAGLTITMFIISCNDASKQDMRDASKNIKEANADVKEAVVATNDPVKATAITNWKTFKNGADSAIAGMEKEAAAGEAKIATANSNVKKKFKTDLNTTTEDLNGLKIKLQKRNVEFESDMKKFDATVVSKNQSFEREFNHDLNGLGTAFKNLFKDNAK